MNCVDRLYSGQIDDSRIAFYFIKNKGRQTLDSAISYRQLKELSLLIQKNLKNMDVVKGDLVLLFEPASPELFATIVALLAMGVEVLLIEPWLPLIEIENIIRNVKPKVFLTGFAGRLFGLRRKVFKKIPIWISSKKLTKKVVGDRFQNDSRLYIEDLPQDHGAILTFTTGTTGSPKGVCRTHGHLIDSRNVVEKYLDYNSTPGSDLTIFTNLALANLVFGKTSLIPPKKLNSKWLESLNDLDENLKPSTIVCNPRFLDFLGSSKKVPSLKAIRSGGALCDINTFEKVFKLYNDTNVYHVYGSTEVEPVSIIDARAACKMSREKNFFQCLAVGELISEVEEEIIDDSFWVAGKHVSPFYLYNDLENQKNKRKLKNNLISHNMGDRISKDKNDILWYCGRTKIPEELFKLEQEIYQYCLNSNGFIHNIGNDKLVFVYDFICDTNKLLSRFSSVHFCHRSKIYRDRRHGSRLDRERTIKKAKL